MGVNKVEYGSSTLVDLTGDTVTPESLLRGYTAHNAAGEQILGTGSGGGGGSMEDTEKLIKQTVGWVSKNYLNTTDLESATDRGITWTVDPDTGVITANGTASGTGSNYSSFFLLNNNSQLMSLRELGLDPNVSYTLNGCPAGGSDNTYSIAIMSPSTIYVQDIGTSDGVTFKFSDYDVGLDDTIGILCIASPGTTLSDAEFKPMLMEYQFDKGYEPGHPPATEYFARIVTCATEAEWNMLPESKKNDPHIWWYRPWMTDADYVEDRTPIGTIIQVTGNFDSTLTPQKSWYPHIPNSEDYLLCTGRQVKLSEYNELAQYFSEVYGDTNYFGDAGSTPIGWFTLPNFTADFPINGMLAIKARMASTKITIAEIDDDHATANNVWSAEKVNSEIEEIKEVEEYDKTNGITIASGINVNASAINQKHCNGITVIDAILYVSEGKAKDTWYTVATVQHHKPLSTKRFIAITYSGAGIAYGRITNTGAIDINTQVALSGASPVGQIYFNFSY